MKSFVMNAIDRVGFMDKPIPKPGPADAIIRTTMALICTSDSHTVHGAIGPRENLTLGHEAVGIVHEVGSEVSKVKPGDRVVSGAITPDWGDTFSQDGHSSQSGGALGGWKFANIKDGVFAEYFHVNDADANLAKIPIGGSVAVFALGPVGLMAVAGARLRGAGKVIAVDLMPARRELAKFYGADITLDPSREDVVARIIEITGGRGVDSAIEALGGDETFQNAVAATRPGGTISNVGYHGKGEFVHLPRLAWGVGMAEKTITTSLCPGGSLRMERMLQLLESRRIDPTPMTTHRFKFDELDKAFEVMDKKLDGVIKPLIIF
jgi:threonine dehydrogenase-like Zn-dependent dehydrogenase